jgi:hypothetical protein
MKSFLKNSPFFTRESNIYKNLADCKNFFNFLKISVFNNLSTVKTGSYLRSQTGCNDTKKSYRCQEVNEEFLNILVTWRVERNGPMIAVKICRLTDPWTASPP